MVPYKVICACRHLDMCSAGLDTMSASACVWMSVSVSVFGCMVISWVHYLLLGLRKRLRSGTSYTRTIKKILDSTEKYKN